MKKLAIIPLLIIMAGCQLGPKYHPPCSPTPEEWKYPHEESNALPDFCNWWEVFQDAILNGLEEQAVGNNPNLFLAMARIEEAWAVAGISLADLFPQVNFNPYFDYFKLRSHIGLSENIKTALKGIPSVGT